MYHFIKFFTLPYSQIQIRLLHLNFSAPFLCVSIIQDYHFCESQVSCQSLDKGVLMAFLNTLCSTICSFWHSQSHWLAWVHSAHNPSWHWHWVLWWSSVSQCLVAAARERWWVQELLIRAPVPWLPYPITAWMTRASAIWTHCHDNTSDLRIQYKALEFGTVKWLCSHNTVTNLSCRHQAIVNAVLGWNRFENNTSNNF